MPGTKTPTKRASEARKGENIWTDDAASGGSSRRSRRRLEPNRLMA